MAHKTEFLYLSEPDTIAAGVLDVPKCINNAEEVFTLLAKGDYLMGGNNHNNHGMYIVFPKESPFPNMPVAGPDRRFVAMPAYLGGRFDICGQKWYGSNAANKSKGLPRSVLMVTLNNKDTGEPLAYMSANLLSAARTGAVPGVATRHLARKDAEVLLCIGCGAIGTSCLNNVITQMPNVKKVICNNHSVAPAEKLAAHVREQFGIEAVVEQDLETAVRQADVINVAASRTAFLNIQGAWVKPGCTILASGPVHFDQQEGGSYEQDGGLWTKMKVVYDHIGISLGAFTGQHLKVEAIDNFLPRKITYWIDLFGDFVSFVYAIVVSYMMWVYIQNIIQFPQYFSSMPWLSAAVMYIPGLIGMIGFCIRIMQASLIPNLKLLRGKAYLTNTIKGPIPQEELDKHNKKKSKKKEEDQ